MGGETISGVGIDIISIKRMFRLYERYSARLVKKLLHPMEMKSFARSRDKAAFLARRFAAKEAVAKALGYGFVKGAFANEIAIAHDEHGRPCGLLPENPSFLPARPRLHLSISDNADYAVAQAILTTNE